MGKLVMIASLKGGVGKTTITASLALALAKAGKKTLAIDMDFGVRSLDIALGHENSASPGCWDVMTGRSSLGIAAEEDERSENLFFMSAPMNVDCTYDENFTDKMLLNFLKSVKKEFDFVVLDMAAGTGRLLDMVSESGELDHIIVVSTQNAASVRAAEKLGSSLFKTGKENIRLIINCFDQKNRAREDAGGVMDIIDSSSVTLLGVIPFDKRVEKLLSNGKTLIEDKRSMAGKAINNITKRLLGESVPLFKGTLSKARRLKLY